ncbi:alpha-L-fucosidase [Zobellia uliginosa]|uniref:Alpha-L-fucosidase n=1 Tax=Zobellia uliginosa TaxID=143224 RepID=A0ABY1KR16_9FLAO|nr:alpha-L-fucosidase [Zobellia uliginosa]
MMEWPEGNKVNIESLGKSSEHGKNLNIKSVKLLGSDSKIEFEVNDDGLNISDLGSKTGEFAHVLEISL